MNNMEKKSILMLLSTYQKMSGHTRVIDNLSVNLIKQGFNISIGALKFEKEPPEGVKKINLSISNVLSNFQYYDIIHNHQTKMNFFSLFTKKPFLFQYHGASTKLQKLNLLISLFICKKHIKKIICVSKSSIKQLPKFTRSQDLLTIYNGIDTKFFIPKNKVEHKCDNPQLLFTGNLFRYKNVQLLIKVIKILRKKFPEICLEIIGEGEFKYNLEKIVEKNKLEKNIIFLGRIDNISLKKKYQNTDIYVSASTFETFGMPLLEAMSCGTPVAVLNIPAHSELVKESGGGMCFSNDASNAASIILEILQKKKSFGENGRKFAEKLDWMIIAEKYSNLYKQFT